VDGSEASFSSFGTLSLLDTTTGGVSLAKRKRVSRVAGGGAELGLDDSEKAFACYHSVAWIPQKLRYLVKRLPVKYYLQRQAKEEGISKRGFAPSEAQSVTHFLQQQIAGASQWYTPRGN